MPVQPLTSTKVNHPYRDFMLRLPMNCYAGGPSPYPAETDFLFPSIRMNGTQPLTPDMLLKRVIRPAAEAAGIHKRVGWHTFRQSLATNLRALASM